MPYLLITGNTNIQRLTSLYVRQIGLTVDIANNGKAGLDKISRKNFDLIMVDMQLPTMSGIETSKNLRKSGYKGIIVALKENASPDNRQSCLLAGCNDVIATPIDRNNFIAMLEDITAKQDLDTSVVQPIKCSMELDDDDVSQLVDKYVTMLPILSADIRQAYEQKDFEKLSGLVHDLKSTGGNYGYMVVSKLAVRMEACIRENELEEIKTILQELFAVAEQIKLGWNTDRNNNDDVAINQ